MKIGLYPGSFDPITIGHISIIEKGARLFDKLYVCLLVNAGKSPMFSDDEKLEMCKLALKKYENVEVVMEKSLTVDACKKYGAKFILRGLRTTADFEYEFESNNINNVLDPSIETVFFMTDIDKSHISSSVVRELINYNSKDYSKLVPNETFNYIEELRGIKKCKM